VRPGRNLLKAGGVNLGGQSLAAYLIIGYSFLVNLASLIIARQIFAQTLLAS
jgi:hypothetical protein